MFTQPNAEQKVTTFDDNGNPIDTWIPIRPDLWPFFSTQDQATSLMSKFMALAPNVKLLDGLGLDWFIPVRYLDLTTKLWVFKGVVPSPSYIRGLDEFAGSIYDRQFKPNPFIDGVGGPNLLAVPITTDLVQCKWGQ
jgi:hypothetical protein